MMKHALAILLAVAGLSGAAAARDAVPPYIGTFSLRTDDKITIVDDLQEPTPYRVCVSDLRDNACKLDLDSGRDRKVDAGNCIDLVVTSIRIKKRAESCIGTYGRVEE